MFCTILGLGLVVYGAAVGPSWWGLAFVLLGAFLVWDAD